ncbi:hypothetical protein C2E23DRAFT_228064 [Lenzites betulinus]|nr:hypothetical protein C2E23DRAFT_228064 [Lenzites betulinus]
MAIGRMTPRPGAIPAYTVFPADCPGEMRPAPRHPASLPGPSVRGVDVCWAGPGRQRLALRPRAMQPVSDQSRMSSPSDRCSARPMEIRYVRLACAGWLCAGGASSASHQHKCPHPVCPDRTEGVGAERSTQCTRRSSTDGGAGRSSEAKWRVSRRPNMERKLPQSEHVAYGYRGQV